MDGEAIWPNGLRYLWTDAFGLVLYVSLYQYTADETWLERARRLVDEVYRVLGRPRGCVSVRSRIGTASIIYGSIRQVISAARRGGGI